MLRRWWAVGFVLLVSGCAGPPALRNLLGPPPTPHAAYARGLRQAHLDKTALGAAWTQAADRALFPNPPSDTLSVSLPVAETGFFQPERPSAAAWRYSVREGETIEVTLAAVTAPNARIFVEVFALPLDSADRRASDGPRPLAWADTTSLSFRYTAEDDARHLLRVQPELLTAGSYTLKVRRVPSLGVFPVKGKSDAAVGSFWGAERDAGARRHEGLDIFAASGTPVVAATAGVVTRVGETPRGGRVVWVADLAQNQHHYYAHLSQQLVQPGQQVQAGDTLGLVGNTGNAITTPPHLHFGIYRGGRGAVDPWPFIRRADAVPPDPAPGLAPGTWSSVKKGGTISANTATAAHFTAKRKEKNAPKPNGMALAAGLPVQIQGRAATGAYLITLPTGETTYVAADALEKASSTALRAIRNPAVATDAVLRTAPSSVALAVAALPSNSRAVVLGQTNGWTLIRLVNTQIGWVPSEWVG